jgi:hypothetical protein
MESATTDIWLAVEIRLVSKLFLDAIPSPRPSPAGRGGIVPRRKINLWRYSARQSSGFREGHKGCSLSPGERVRVRGNGAVKHTKINHFARLS